MPKKQKRPAAEIDRVVAQFEKWRKQKRMGERIPARLWKAAARLSKSHGICQVALALRLSYYDLKKRVDGSAERQSKPRRRVKKQRSPAVVSPTFVELDVAARKPECLIELENLRGEKLKIELRGGSLDLESLTRLFWSREK